MTTIWLNSNEITDHQQTKIPLKNIKRGVAYGDGFFDTICVTNGVIEFKDDHISRIENGLKLGDYHPFADWKSILTQAAEKARTLSIDKARLRIQFFREGNYGYHTDADCETHVLVELSESSGKINRNYELITASVPRIPRAAMPGNVKWSNGMNYIFARQEAQKTGANDALMLTMDGFISETTISNIFWRIGNDVYMPSDECDQLSGIMMRNIAQFVEESSKLNLRRGKFKPEVFAQAESVWVSNSMMRMQPIRSLDDHQFTWTKTDELLRRTLLSYIEDQHRA